MLPTSKKIVCYSLTLKAHKYNFSVYQEESLSWKEHNEIHAALNLAYGKRTAAFIHKSYAHRAPKIRILCRHEGRLIGHTAIFEDYVVFKKKKVIVGGLV